MTLAETLTALRAANIARQAEWEGGVDLPLSFRIIELGGEVGEALNIVKKLERERLGLAGSRATAADLAAELADVVICADLVAGAIDAEPLDYDWPRPVRSDVNAGLGLLYMAGLIASTIEDHAGDIAAMVSNGILDDLDSLIWRTAKLADAHDIDLPAAIVAKFNATSDKHHWATYMDRPPTSPAMVAIKAERRRQIAEERFTADHDDQYRTGELLSAARAYVYAAAQDPDAVHGDTPPPTWPWPWVCWKPYGRVRNLVRAGALCLAQLDRSARMGASDGGNAPYARKLLEQIEVDLTDAFKTEGAA